jgi:hypothetical protein
MMILLRHIYFYKPFIGLNPRLQHVEACCGSVDTSAKVRQVPGGESTTRLRITLRWAYDAAVQPRCRKSRTGDCGVKIKTFPVR